MLRAAFILVVMLFAMRAIAQNEPVTVDTLKTIPADSLQFESGQEVINIQSYASRFDPRKALLFSAIFPGAGQIYNKKYWKLPIVYGGFGVGVYMVTFYQDRYKIYKNELFNILNGDSAPTLGFNETQLRTLVTKTKRERDFFSIITMLWYVLQVVDAHVDAHLKEFDVNPQLKLSLEPMMEQNQFTGRNSGLSLKIKF